MTALHKIITEFDGVSRDALEAAITALFLRLVGEDEICDTCRNANSYTDDMQCTCYKLQDSNRIRHEIRERING